MRTFHIQINRTKQQPETGRHIYALGARFGYWPCLKAPFLQVNLGSYRLDVWHGLPSYKVCD